MVNYGLDKYDYIKLESDLVRIAKEFKIPLFKIGKSYLGKNLYVIKIGYGKKNVLYNGTHHGLEWITAPLLVRFAHEMLTAERQGKRVLGYSIQDLFDKCAIHIIPMLNPDGTELVINGLNKEHPFYESLFKFNRGNDDFESVWQANARGVDLNHNYDAGWKKSKVSEFSCGISGPGPTRFSGKCAESEKETRALANYVRRNRFALTLAYHSQGEVIYWDFMGEAPKESLEIGAELSRVSGYMLDTAVGMASYAGFKDWFIKEFQRPGFTIEVGRGMNPLPISQFDKIYDCNLELMILAAFLA